MPAAQRAVASRPLRQEPMAPTPLIGLLLAVGADGLCAGPLHRVQARHLRTNKVLLLETAQAASDAAVRDALAADRYVATNRFSVRDGKGPKFEQRWANRKSRLATLPGFRYFHLMRQVELTEPIGKEEHDYVSLTIWEDKDAFTAWRKGDAFREAHGGTSIFDFVSTLVSSARILKGAPSPVFYDGLLHMGSGPPVNAPATVDGWRQVDADGEGLLPAECFVACNRFCVRPEAASVFEERWASRTSSLRELDGFISFTMLRRDFGQKGHGAGGSGGNSGDDYNYMSCTIWRDRAAFDGWRQSQQFGNAHKGGEKKEEKSDPPSTPSPWTKPPSPVFYEGVLTIFSEKGT